MKTEITVYGTGIVPGFCICSAKAMVCTTVLQPDRLVVNITL
jgi:hypothetical protein